MAVYHKHLQYHEDTVKKRNLQEEEKNFLMNLQKEMNTQDNVGQADPRFWVIQGSEKVYGIETGYEDGSDLVSDSETVATDMISAYEYIRENLLTEINDTDGIQRSIELERGIFHPTIAVKWQEDGYEDCVTFEHMEDVAEWLNEMGYEVRVANYRIERKIYPNTLFLTQKAAEEHLKSNYYHYSEDAHTYAMTSWRNPETERLWKVLREVDWREGLFEVGVVWDRIIEELANEMKREILTEIYNTSETQKIYEVGSEMSITCSHIMGTLKDVKNRIVDKVVKRMKEVE